MWERLAKFGENVMVSGFGVQRMWFREIWEPWEAVNLAGVYSGITKLRITQITASQNGILLLVLW